MFQLDVLAFLKNKDLTVKMHIYPTLPVSHSNT